MDDQHYQDFSQLFAVGSPQAFYKAFDLYGEIKLNLSDKERDKGRDFLQQIIDTPP